MQDLKIYIVIQDPNTKQDVNITGDFELLRAFLSGVGSVEVQAAPIIPASIETAQPIPHKRKSNKRAKAELTAA